MQHVNFYSMVYNPSLTNMLVAYGRNRLLKHWSSFMQVLLLFSWQMQSLHCTCIYTQKEFRKVLQGPNIGYKLSD